MKRLLGILSSVALLSFTSSAQESNTEISKPSRDFITLSFHYDTWMNTNDEIQITGFGRGFSGHISYDFPINESHFSFAPGIGISSSNIFFKNQLLNLNQIGDQIEFIDIESNKTSSYKQSKYNYTYLEAPFELRFFSNKNNRNKGFKASLGMKVGLLMGAKTRVKHTLAGPTIVEKVNSKKYLATWRFQPTVRLGYGNFSVFGSYQISSLFNPGEGPTVYPLSIGISISGL